MAELGARARPVDPHVDLRVTTHRREPRAGAAPVLAVISAGGVLGALARYGLSVALPSGGPTVPWGTFLANVTGCLLIGVLMALITEIWSGRRLVRPFLGVGVLGGYTTFSTAMVDTERLVRAHAPGVAVGYLFGTLCAALCAVWAGDALGQLALRAGLRPVRRGR